MYVHRPPAEPQQNDDGVAPQQRHVTRCKTSHGRPSARSHLHGPGMRSTRARVPGARAFGIESSCPGHHDPRRASSHRCHPLTGRSRLDDASFRSTPQNWREGAMLNPRGVLHPNSDTRHDTVRAADSHQRPLRCRFRRCPIGLACRPDNFAMTAIGSSSSL